MRNLLQLFVLTLVISVAVRAADGEKYALVVGVDSYSADRYLKNLRYAESDAAEVARALVDAGFKPANVRLLLAGEYADTQFKRLAPTKRNIDAELDALVLNKKEDDTIVAAFFGHGVQFLGKEQAYFCAGDSGASNPESLLELNALTARLDTSKAGGKIAIFDCCRGDMLLEHSDDAAYDRVGTAKDAYKLTMPGSVVAFFSSGAGEVSREEPAFKGGVFAHFLAEGLRGKAAHGGVLGIGSLAGYVQLNVSGYATKTFNASQIPVVKINRVTPLVLSRTMEVAKIDPVFLPPQKLDAPPVKKEDDAKPLEKPKATVDEPIAARRAKFDDNGVLHFKASSSAQQLGIDAQGTLGNGLTTLEFDFSLERAGRTRSVILNEVQFKRVVNGFETMNYDLSKDKAIGISAGVKTEYTDEKLPAQFKAARANLLDRPLVQYELDANGRVEKERLLIGLEDRNALDTLEWGIVDFESGVQQPYMAAQEEWQNEAHIGVGFGISFQGVMTLKRISKDGNLRKVRVSGTFVLDGAAHPLLKADVRNARLVLDGVQTYDIARKEWIGGEYTGSFSCRILSEGKEVQAQKSLMVTRFELKK
ncbi:MAG TPA: caspase family protein [Planctomycetota bacterium]|nr:caspase family protein [Planctomycetota bacterium]